MAYSSAPHPFYNSEDTLQRKKYVKKMEEFQDAAFEEAKTTLAMSIEWNRVPHYIKFLEGNWWDQRRPRYLSPFFDNRLQHARYSKLALLTDIKPIIDVSTDVKEYEEDAKIAEMLIKHEWFRGDLDLSLVSVADASFLFGNGFWKITAHSPGYTKISSSGPDMVLPIQPGFHVQDSTAILYRTYKPLSYFQRVFPLRCEGLEQEAVQMDYQSGETWMKPWTIDEYTWNAMSPQMKRQVGTRAPKNGMYGNQQFPVIELQEYWVDDQNINDSKQEVLIKDPYMSEEQHNYWYRVPPMGRLYPRKRLIVFAGKRLMYDGPSPFWHGLFPFAMLRMNPVLWSFWGLSLYRNLIELNKSINEIGAGTMDLVKRALNPQMLTKEGAVPKPAWDVFFANMPGGKLRLGPTSNPATDVRFMEPPNIPAYVPQMLTGFLAPEFDRMSGYLDPARVTGKKQVPGGETIESMRDSMSTATRLEGRYVEAFLRDAGTILLSNLFQFYSARQRLKILGDNGLTWADFDGMPENGMVPEGKGREDHWKLFSFNVAQGSLHGNSKDRDRTIAISLAKMGLISRAELYRRLDVPNGEQIEKELVQEHQALGNLQGRTPRQTRGQRTGSPI